MIVLHPPALPVIPPLLCPWERKLWFGARCFLHFSCPVFPLKLSVPSVILSVQSAFPKIRHKTLAGYTAVSRCNTTLVLTQQEELPKTGEAHSLLMLVGHLL